MIRVALFSSLVLGLVACGKSADPSCETALKHVAKLADLEEKDQIAGAIELCKTEKWSGKVRRCLVNAKNRDDVEKCEPEGGGKQPEAKSKRSEAEVNLDAIKKGMKAYYAENAGFPVGTAGLTPAEPCCDSGEKDRKCLPDPSLWTGAGAEVWDQLMFSIDESHYFRYSYTGTAESATVTAEGDLDCDDAPVTYTLTAESNGGSPTFTLEKPARAD